MTFKIAILGSELLSLINALQITSPTSSTIWDRSTLINNVYWTSESNDPSEFCIILLNGAVGVSQQFGTAQTSTSQWGLTGISDDPPGDGYQVGFLTNCSAGYTVLAQSDKFSLAAASAGGGGGTQNATTTSPSSPNGSSTSVPAAQPSTYMSAGAKAGIAVGVLLVVLAVCTLCFWLWTRRRGRNQRIPGVQIDPANIPYAKPELHGQSTQVTGKARDISMDVLAVTSQGENFALPTGRHARDPPRGQQNHHGTASLAEVDADHRTGELYCNTITELGSNQKAAELQSHKIKRKPVALPSSRTYLPNE